MNSIIKIDKLHPNLWHPSKPFGDKGVRKLLHTKSTDKMKKKKNLYVPKGKRGDLKCSNVLRLLLNP